MGLQHKLLFVTDLDATLLDHTYSYEAAGEAIARLRELGLPLVLNSSKTLAEMEDLAKELKLDSPIVAENGGLLAIQEERGGNYTVEIHGVARSEILSAAHQLRHAMGYRFAGFADWSDQELAERTGLTVQQAQRSRSRLATEPIVWNDTELHRIAFAEALAVDGIRMLRGGRFWHLMGTADKADGLTAVFDFFKTQEPTVNWIVVALGDSANDTAMLEAADIAVVIPHADGPHITPQAPRVLQAPFPTSKGWNAAVLSILNEYC
ncbi:HAD-IIB family hydrolase [Coraliomargarita sp. SDUM461004]|uniref:HAD-IIB family hydrolase n=1 Tax=Thalassobacterium sedimentorum TaxID=3041258 RepID=A0ABU1ALJ3_9BACT|nr:HAD-IIB family hydrolase [Coraliomargarita sp. SDUM461004]MDQ8195078.1 HAD-IIB family hydrolase [Coraliomargarita sp. SDUM461004]